MTHPTTPGVRATCIGQSLYRVANLALLTLPMCFLVACGGGESEESVPGPTMVRVDTPLRAATAGGIASTGIELSGALNYQVWGSGDVAGGAGVTANGQVAAVANYSHGGNLLHYDSSITFPSALPFTTGLVIGDAYRGVTWPTDSSDLIVVKGGGVSSSAWPASNTPWGSGRLLSQGNYFVFCSAGAAQASISSQTARTGAQVAVSSRFEPMDNIAALYGKVFYRFDCAGTTNKTTFGDGQGHLTMAFDGITLSEAQTVQAFSNAGYVPAAGQIIKRRAYSLAINGVTRTVIVALDNLGAPYASVLFQTE